MAAPATEHEILDVNRRYHDVAAHDYDAKWGIDYGEVGAAQVLGKLSKLLGAQPGPYARSLEIGAGTGYFSLNLLRAGVVGAATCTDISPGMLAGAARRTRGGSASTSRPPPATPPSCRSRTRRSTSCSATPCCTTCPTSSARSRSSRACCAPAGRCSSPASRRARATASPPGRSAPRCAPRRCGARRSARGPPCAARATAPAPSAEDAEHALESVVDVHAFDPADLQRLMQGAGLADTRVRGEELLANWFGWFNRTLEASANHDDIPWLWFQYAFRGYLGLQKVDRALLEPRLPPQVFYNLMIAARKP